MWTWLLAPIDPARAHDVGMLLSWHGRAMTVAWGVLVPLGVAAAFAFKVIPGQNWPAQLDNRTWWNTHRFALVGAVALTFVGIVIAKLISASPASLTETVFLHRWLGWTVATLITFQLISARLRGTKGGPTDPKGMRGDHFDMTRQRRIFEAVHKTSGYLALVLGGAAVLTGLWQANAPRWMWVMLVGFWFALLAPVLIWRRLRPLTTYQAIWGIRYAGREQAGRRGSKTSMRAQHPPD